MSSLKKKRINIDLPGGVEGKTLQFIMDWEGVKLKPFIEDLVAEYLKTKIEENKHFKDYFDGEKEKNDRCK